jgi:hypothetical protein
MSSEDSGLLLSCLEEQRLATHVTRLPVKGYPRGVVAPVLRDEGTLSVFDENTLPKQDLIANLSGAGSLALYRKKAPHCLYGMMLVSTETTTQTALADFEAPIRANFFQVVAKFGQHCRDQDLMANVSFTYDPNTKDRKSGQSQKWFHWHLNSSTPAAIQEIERTRKPLATEPSEMKRRALVEEFAIVSSMILADRLRTAGLMVG